MVAQAHGRDKFPLVLGGDHSIAVGTVAGVSKHLRERREKLGMIWIDAHADMNTPDTSPSGNVHGMPLACCIGAGPEELTSIFGYLAESGSAQCRADRHPLRRRTGARQCPALRRACFTMRDIDERGLRTVIEEAIRIAGSGTAGFHVSLDMDSVDPDEAPGVGTPVRGGITYREAHLAMEMLSDSGSMTVHGSGGSKSRDRRSEPNRHPGRRTSDVRHGKENSVAE